MKFTLIKDTEREEEVVVYCHAECALTEKLCELVREEMSERWGYAEDGSIQPLNYSDVSCFIVEGGAVYAITDTGRLRLRERLYRIEQELGDSFVRINQSAIANLGRVEKFDVTIGGALTVIFKNGYRDYVSRRQLRAVKERLKG